MGEREEKILFVGRLPSGTTALDLKTIFGRVIYNKERLVVDRVDVKGHYGFVYIRGRNLNNLVDYLNPQFINDIKIKIEYARINEIEKIKSRQNYPENRTLFVTDFLPNYNNSKEFNKLFSKYGELVNLAIKTKFAFVEYQNIDDAIYARKKLNGYLHNGRQITVSYAATKDIKREEKRRYLQFPGYNRDRGNDNRFKRRNRYRSYSSSNSRSHGSRSRSRSRSRDRHKYRDKRRYRDRSRERSRDKHRNRYDSYHSQSRSVSKSKSRSNSIKKDNSNSKKTDADDNERKRTQDNSMENDGKKSHEKDDEKRSKNKDNDKVNGNKDTRMDES